MCTTTDKNGFLWIGTANGLNRYDGYVVTAYYQSNQPGLCSNDITGIFCDSRNRIWAGSAHGVTMIDEQRKFHKINLNDSVQTNYSCAVIIETKSHGVILFTNKGHYYFNEKDNKWLPLAWSTAREFRSRGQDNSRFEAEQYIRIGAYKLFIIDYATQKKDI